jgi:uncharacterized Fe-S cluster-containing radical SAM superfamily protein
MNPRYAEDTAPYMRFQPRRFYGGIYTADIFGCNWTCDSCWSKFGWRGVEPKFILTSDEVVQKLVGGMERNGLIRSRISGGEPSLYWKSHLFAVTRKFLEAGDDTYLIIETNGTAFGPEDIDKLEEAVGEKADRVQFTVGVKATSGERLAELTGQTVETAKRFRKNQLELVYHLAQPERLVTFSALFLDSFVDDDELEAFTEALEEIVGGPLDETTIDLQQFKTTGWGAKQHSEKNYQPKRRKTQ